MVLEMLPLGRVRFLVVPPLFAVPFELALLTVPDRETAAEDVGLAVASGLGVIDRVDNGVVRPLALGSGGMSPLATGSAELRLLRSLLPPADQVLAPPMLLLLTLINP